jgi:hypothetical protein
MGALLTATDRPFTVVHRLWPGETVVILGGGSSLTPEDVNACRGRRVIAIKEAYQLAPWADLLYAADAKWWAFYKGAPTFKGMKFAIEQSPDQPPTDWSQWPDVHVLRQTGELGLELEPTGLRTGYNSGYQAVNLAVHLGAAQIVLLGFDCWTGPTGDQNWFGYHPLHTPSPYPLFLHAFQSVITPLREAGVHVVNASRFTVLSAFPRLSLDEALQ